jgi:hypothetical protein
MKLPSTSQPAVAAQGSSTKLPRLSTTSIAGNTRSVKVVVCVQLYDHKQRVLCEAGNTAGSKIIDSPGWGLLLF